MVKQMREQLKELLLVLLPPRQRQALVHPRLKSLTRLYQHEALPHRLTLSYCIGSYLILLAQPQLIEY